MVQALYLALRLFISGYSAPTLIHTDAPKRRHRGVPANGTAFGPRRTQRGTQRRWQSRSNSAHR
jgi:hypothetical protein